MRPKEKASVTSFSEIFARSDAIVHVVRCFSKVAMSPTWSRVSIRYPDAETVETELMLSDLESLERRILPLEKRAKTGDKEAILPCGLMNKALELLREGRPARQAQLTPEERGPYRQLGLLTEKPVLYVCNVDEASAASGNGHSARLAALAKQQAAGSIVISARMEEELTQLSAPERDEFLGSLGLTEPGLNRLIRAGYDLLGLITFFTAGPKETRAWTVEKGARAPRAASVIHSDFEKGFIRAETIAYDDYVANNGEAGARDAGKFRLEGKEYVVQDGDVMRTLSLQCLSSFMDSAPAFRGFRRGPDLFARHASHYRRRNHRLRHGIRSAAATSRSGSGQSFRSFAADWPRVVGISVRSPCA